LCPTGTGFGTKTFATNLFWQNLWRKNVVLPKPVSITTVLCLAGIQLGTKPTWQSAAQFMKKVASQKIKTRLI
jgi:hypothetical protein